MQRRFNNAMDSAPFSGIRRHAVNVPDNGVTTAAEEKIGA